MTKAQETRIYGYYWIEHLGKKKFAVCDVDGAGPGDTIFETRREAEKYILALQQADEERRWEV